MKRQLTQNWQYPSFNNSSPAHFLPGSQRTGANWNTRMLRVVQNPGHVTSPSQVSLTVKLSLLFKTSSTLGPHITLIHKKNKTIFLRQFTTVNAVYMCLSTKCGRCQSLTAKCEKMYFLIIFSAATAAPAQRGCQTRLLWKKIENKQLSEKNMKNNIELGLAFPTMHHYPMERVPVILYYNKYNEVLWCYKQQCMVLVAENTTNVKLKWSNFYMFLHRPWRCYRDGASIWNPYR